MILICHEHIPKPEVNSSEDVIAFFTIILAIATIALVYFTWKLVVEAKRQLGKVHVQAAENIILKQIDFHYNILSGIKKSIPTEDDIFGFLYEDKLRKAYTIDPLIYKADNDGDLEKCNNAYQIVFNDYGNLLGHYYRNLYRIFKKIDETKLSDFDHDHYAKLVRAQLSEYEILLMFYNCLWVGDDDKFKKLIEKYQLLQGIKHSKLLERRHKDLYNENSYGDE